MSWVIVLILIYISIIDSKFHRIPNVALAFLTPITFLHFIVGEGQWAVQFQSTLIVFAIALFLWRFLGLGMGDVKLLVLLSLFLIPGQTQSFLLFLSYFSIASLIHLVGLRITARVWNSRIPLAPSISIATILVPWVK